MPEQVPEFVRVPKAVFDSLERQAKRGVQLEESLKDFAAATRGYTIKAVITHPASEHNAPMILHAVEGLLRLVRT